MLVMLPLKVSEPSTLPLMVSDPSTLPHMVSEASTLPLMVSEASTQGMLTPPLKLAHTHQSCPTCIASHKTIFWKLLL